MDRQRWLRLEPILDRAVRLVGVERARYLDGACARDPTMRADIERLLAERESSHTSRGGSDVETDVDPREIIRKTSHEAPPIGQLGDFILIREIGRGGMGIVYEAEQVSLRRKVALKLLPPGLGLSSRAIARFEREAHAAAQLHHSHIVPVHATGHDAGYHYYAMELIDGQPLSRVLADLRGRRSSALLDATLSHDESEARAREEDPVAAPEPSTSMSDSSSQSRQWFDTVARLLADVADALHHAHTRGVIHRDVKPANLLLSKDGRLCVTDFGLARVVQEPGMTISGSFLGTPSYMSPEMIAAGRVQVDHRTDIYSLGAVLYEMLTLELPFPGDSREAILTGIMTKDPRPPRKLNSRVPLDLETICHKAMEKIPEQRYRSAADFAADLRQYLGRGLIAARRAGPLRRTAKWVRRHPVASSLTAATVAVTVLGGVALEQGFGRSTANAHRLVGEAELALREGRVRDGMSAVDRALAIAPELLDAKETRGRLLWDLRRDRELATLAKEILASHPDDWEAHAWLVFAAKYGKLADIPADEHAAAVQKLAPDSADGWFVKGLVGPANREAVRCFSRALDLDPGHFWALLQRAETLRILGDYPAAIADLERAIAVRPRSTRGRRFLAKTLVDWSHDVEKGMGEYDKAIAIDPMDPDTFIDRANAYRVTTAQNDRCLADLTRAVELMKPPYSDPGAPSSNLATIFRARADVLQAMGRYEDALNDARRSIEIEPDRSRPYRYLLAGLKNLKRTHELRAATEDLRRRADGWADKSSASELYLYLSDSYLFLGETDQAIAAATRAIELKPDNLKAYVWRSDARRRTEGQAAVEQECDRIARVEATEPTSLKDRGYAMYWTCRRLEPALADYARAIEMAPSWADVFIARARIFRNEKRFAEELADADKAIELAPKWVEAIFSRAYVNFTLERWPEALTDLERCFSLGTTGENVSWLQAQSLAHLNREVEAIGALDKLIVDRPEFELAYRWRSILSFSLGRLDESAKAAEKTVAVAPKAVWPHLHRAYVLAYRPATSCDQVMAELDKAAELEPANVETKWQRVLIGSGRLAFLCPGQVSSAKQVEIARELVAYNPNNSDYRLVGGMASYQSGQFAEARSSFLNSIELAPAPNPDPEALFWLAMSEAKLGKNAEARRTYDRAVARMNKTWPKHPALLALQAQAKPVVGIH